VELLAGVGETRAFTALGQEGHEPFLSSMIGALPDQPGRMPARTISLSCRGVSEPLQVKVGLHLAKYCRGSRAAWQATA
jgi:hypothetical protein